MFSSLTIIGTMGKDAERKGDWILMRVGFRPMPKDETIWANVRTRMQWCGALTAKTRVMIQGTPSFKVWNADSGAKVDITIFANNVVTLSPRDEAERTPRVDAPAVAAGSFDEDIPF